MEKIIIREYLESLKEDAELDYIFVLLLETMGFQIVTTPKQYKGYSQYGKDVIAVKVDIDGITKRFYFELKGGSDRNITPETFSKDDGIRQSLIEAKDSIFTTSLVPNFDKLPKKVLVVHNGFLKPGAENTFNGFISREFPANNPDLVFEHWDINKLTDLFNEYLFGAYLLVDKEAAHLFKKITTLFDTPQHIFPIFQKLIQHLLEKGESLSLNKDNSIPRELSTLMHSFELIGYMIFTFSKEAKNLEPAKECVTYLLLNVWGFLLSKKWEHINKLKQRFDKILELHTLVLKEYFDKTLEVAQLPKGLYFEDNGSYESVGYPLRCMDYLKYLVYYFLRIEKQPSTSKEEVEKHLEIMTNVIFNNSDGVFRPILDNHSIPLFMVIKYFAQYNATENIKVILDEVLNNLAISKVVFKLPDGGNNLKSVINTWINKKDEYYTDSTSSLLGMLFELIGTFNLLDEYEHYKKAFQGVELCIFVPFSTQLLKEHNISECSLEELLFKKELRKEGYQSQIILDESFEAFKEKTKNKKEFSQEWITDTQDMFYLRWLAHTFYNTPFFPSDWRE